MSDIRPFQGLRPRADLVEQVASPPYDVLSSAEARAMAADNPVSFLHVNKAEIDLPEDADVHGDAVYDQSAENLRRMIDDGVLVRDPGECFYIYRLRMGEHVQHGIVAGFSVQEYEDGLIKKHELTRREKEDDRARHVERLMANAGPVLLTHRNTPVLQDIVAGVSQTAPAVDFTADDGIGHTVWVISDPVQVQAIGGAFAEIPATYVADGHHRSASAFRVRDNLRAKNPDHTGASPTTTSSPSVPRRRAADHGLPPRGREPERSFPRRLPGEGGRGVHGRADRRRRAAGSAHVHHASRTASGTASRRRTARSPPTTPSRAWTAPSCRTTCWARSSASTTRAPATASTSSGASAAPASWSAAAAPT